jgi:hypothetical protein
MLASDNANEKLQALRYRVADKVNSCLKWLSPLHAMFRVFLSSTMGEFGHAHQSTAAPEATNRIDAGSVSRGPRKRLRSRFVRDHAGKAA